MTLLGLKTVSVNIIARLTDLVGQVDWLSDLTW